MKRIIASMMMLCLTAAYAQEKTDTTLMEEVTVSNSKDNSAFGEAPSRRGCRVSKFAMDSFLAST